MEGKIFFKFSLYEQGVSEQFNLSVLFPILEDKMASAWDLERSILTFVVVFNEFGMEFDYLRVRGGN